MPRSTYNSLPCMWSFCLSSFPTNAIFFSLDLTAELLHTPPSTTVLLPLTWPVPPTLFPPSSSLFPPSSLPLPSLFPPLPSSSPPPPPSPSSPPALPYLLPSPLPLPFLISYPHLPSSPLALFLSILFLQAV